MLTGTPQAQRGSVPPRHVLTRCRTRRSLYSAQLLDPQKAPFSAKRWYNASTEKVSPNMGFIDAMWDEDGTLVHKRVGETYLKTHVPAVSRPAGEWRGTRITQVGVKFWPDVAGDWDDLMSAGGDEEVAATWHGTPRVLMLQSGTWYRSLSNGRSCFLREDLCNVRGAALKRVFVDEGQQAVDALDDWAAAHRDARLDVYLTTVACPENSEPCRPSMREGLYDALLPPRDAPRRAHWHRFDLAALAYAAPKERANSHPSLALSAWIYSTFLTHICGAKDRTAPTALRVPSSGCAPAEQLEFDAACMGAAMTARCEATKCGGWSAYQHVPCSFRIMRA